MADQRMTITLSGTSQQIKWTTPLAKRMKRKLGKIDFNGLNLSVASAVIQDKIKKTLTPRIQRKWRRGVHYDPCRIIPEKALTSLERGRKWRDTGNSVNKLMGILRQKKTEILSLLWSGKKKSQVSWTFSCLLNLKKKRDLTHKKRE